MVNYCNSLNIPLDITFVKNPKYEETNYIYSIYCAKDKLRGDDIVMMHGDLVFEGKVFNDVVLSDGSCMTVSSTVDLPEKDFKAVINGDKITAVGIEFFENAVTAQPLYRLAESDFGMWLDKIDEFCENNNTGVYAENAFNEISDKLNLKPLDVRNELCCEIDTPEDLSEVTVKVREAMRKTVYMCVSADMVHSGHIAIIRKASALGRLTVGVLSDEAVASYKRFSDYAV